MAKEAISNESRWKSDMQDTIQAELKNAQHQTPKPKIDPRKLWICEADEEINDPRTRRKRRKIPKVPNPNIGVRNLLSHIHNAATPTCCIRADHGAGRSTLGHHLASTWTSEGDDIPNLKTFPAVFFVSARSIVDVVKHMSVDTSADENAVNNDGGLLDVCENGLVSKVKAPTEHAEVSDTEPIEREIEVREISPHSPLVKLSLKLRTGLHALVSSLLPITSAIYGPAVISEWVLEKHILLIIDDAEDFRTSELEFLQQVFRHTGGAAATIILMTDSYGYERVTDTWAGIALSKLDLLGLGRADIVTAAEFYLEAKRTENSMKSDCSSLRPETHLDEPTFGEERTKTNTSEDYPQPVQKASEISNENAENSEHSALNTMDVKRSNKTKAGEIKSTSTDNSNNSREGILSLKDQENNNIRTSDSKDSENITNPATFLDLMTGKKSIRKRNVHQKDDACCRPKGIGDFLSRNMCRLEKVLRFPEILMRTCDMFVDSLDLFDEITTATDLLWTLIHWEGAKVISHSDSTDDSEKYFSNGTESLKGLERCTGTSKSALDFESSKHTLDSSKSSSNFFEPTKEFSESARTNLRDMDKTFYEKMYSWLLLIGEMSLIAFVNNERMESDDFEKVKTQTIEMFGNKVAEIMMNRVFKYSDFFGFSSIPENVENFVAEHLYTDHHSGTTRKPDSSDREVTMPRGDPAIVISNEHSATLSIDNSDPHESLTNEKILSPESTDTTMRLSEERDGFVTAAENSEIVTEQNNDHAQNVAQVDLQAQAEVETPERISLQNFDENFTDSCSSDDCVQVNGKSLNLKITQSECLSQDDSKSGPGIDTCSADFWGEILGNDNVSYPDSVDTVQEPDKFPNLKPSSPILGNNLAVTGNCDHAINDKTERAHSPTERKSPVVHYIASNDSVRDSVETLLNKRSLETLMETEINEGVGNNLDEKYTENSSNEQQSVTKQVICEKKIATCENRIIETLMSDEKCDISKGIPLKDEETFETNEDFDNSPDDFWGEILGSSSNETHNELKFEEDDVLSSKYTDRIILGNEENHSVRPEIRILKNEEDSKESAGQKETRSEISRSEYINLKPTADPTHAAVALEVSLIENINNGDFPEGSKDHELEGEDTQSVNTNINGVVKPLQDHKNFQESKEISHEMFENQSSGSILSNYEKNSHISVNTQIPQGQRGSDENSEEISSLIFGGMADDCLTGNLSEKLSSTRSVLEASKENTNCEEIINGQAVQDELSDGYDSNKNTNNQTDIIHNKSAEQLVNTNISIKEQVLCHTEDQEKQQTHENNESREKQQTCDNGHPVIEETAAVQQYYPINDLVESTMEVEKEQQITNHEKTVPEQQETAGPVNGLSSDNESTNKKQHMQQRIKNILQVLGDQIVPPPTPTLSTRNSVTTQFLASWFLVHEIQAGRSLASLTYGSRCCLRQLCILSAGLVNRIRRLVGYNSELNRRRVVCALLNHRSDSSDDLLFNMDLVAEFKAYPDLLSFTVEASEYPDEWHVSLYEAQLVPLQALLLNVAPSRIFLNVEEARPFSEASSILEFLPRVEILVWLDSGRQFAYGNTDRMDKIAVAFTADVVLAKVELVAGCLTHGELVNLPSHDPFKNLVYLKLRVTDMCSLSSLLSIDLQLKALLWLEVKLDFDWLSEEEGQINSLPRSSVPLFDVYLRDCVDEHVVHVSNLLAHMHLHYSGIHLESTSLTPEGVYVLLKQLQQKEIRLYSHPTARQRFRRWYYPQLADGPAPTDDLARKRLGFDDRVFYSNHRVESSTYATAIDAWNLTSFLEEEDRIVHFVYTTENLNFVKRLTGCVEVEKIGK